MTLFKLGNELLYARTGKTFFNSDPLVFDLGGTGVNLTALSGAAPVLDMRGNGFAAHTGWIGVNNGILVLQQQQHSLRRRRQRHLSFRPRLRPRHHPCQPHRSLLPSGLARRHSRNQSKLSSLAFENMATIAYK
jgi:hypothetical protein